MVQDRVCFMFTVSLYLFSTVYNNIVCYVDSTVGKAFRVVGVVIRWFRTIEPRRVAGILVSLAGLAAFAAIMLNGVPVGKVYHHIL